MKDVRRDLRTRSSEVARYLATLRFIEDTGAELVSSNGVQRRRLDPTTIHVLKGSVFLHLYNLVESTVTACLTRIANEVRDSQMAYEGLSDEWRKRWLEGRFRPEELQTPEKRIKKLLQVCEDLVGHRSIDHRPSLRGGNLDASRIETEARRFGIAIMISQPVAEAVKRPVVDERGPMALVLLRRNELAHGLSSFADCGRPVSVRDLRKWTAGIVCYLRELVSSFEVYLQTRGFERRRPA